MLDDERDLTDNEMAEYWWARLTDEERSAWLKAAQSVDAADAWEAYKRRWRKCRAGVCSLATRTGQPEAGLALLCQKLYEIQCYQWVSRNHGVQENLAISMC
jgi:hypothetical protein